MGNTRVYSMDKSIGEINMSEITVDINLCTHCFEDTSFSAKNGKRVNRIPSDAGWMCAECQSVPCDNCEKLTLSYEVTPDGNWICEDCIKVDVR